MSEAAFDYSRAARDAGWHQIGDHLWGLDVEGSSAGAYEGNVRELCFFLGKGPEFEAWKLEPYAEPTK